MPWRANSEQSHIMAELVTIARPYAQAVFSVAKDKGQLGRWSEMLRFMAEIWSNDQVQQALANPSFTKDDVERLLLAICGESLDGIARNLLVILVHNDRLPVLPHIAELYERLRERYENVVEAKVDSAFPLSEQQLASLVASLERRTGCKVEVTVAVTPELIGGVTVTIGDDVWDGSVRGQLSNMATALTNEG
jgi:F-type H+-transporting ATPase subunit delta